MPNPYGTFSRHPTHARIAGTRGSARNVYVKRLPRPGHRDVLVIPEDILMSDY
ncbi:MAG: hypothetical protein ACYTDV_02280 [Planctomycetota bacterium]|jgi:hypothetical protein